MRQQNLVVVGVGYVGLPLALLAREKGYIVAGLDTNEKKVDKINAGESPIQDKTIIADLKKYPITATTNPACVKKADIIVIAVPTPVTSTNVPDLQPLISALENIRPHLQPQQVLSIESTINPGVMDEVVMPLLKEQGAAGHLHVVHCPERVNPGDPKWTVRNIPRVIGGYSSEGVTKAREFYESILEAPIMEMGSATEAEAVKIMENTFRDVNIAYVNEMAKSFARLGIDITNVIKGAATKPFAFMPHYPGNGVGGHCISVDPYYLIERARQVGFEHKFLQLARDINDSMPAYAVELLHLGLHEAGLAGIPPANITVALLGLAYKKNVDDLRNSPALVIKKLLEKESYQLRIFDPYLPNRQASSQAGLPHKSTVASVTEAITGAHAIMLATDHAEIVKNLTPTALKTADIKLIIDGKNALSPQEIRHQNIIYHGIGR